MATHPYDLKGKETVFIEIKLTCYLMNAESGAG